MCSRTTLSENGVWFATARAVIGARDTQGKEEK